MLPLSSAGEDAGQLTREALALARQDPPRALVLMRQAAERWMRQDEPRRAALVLHRRAALALAEGHSPVPDLALAARLLDEAPDERSLVLMDLGYALAQRGDLRRATLVLLESETLARQVGNYELTAAARHTLGKVAIEAGDFATGRDFLKQSGQAMVYDIEHDLLTTLRDIGNLPHDPWAEQERARRAQAVEDELAALKREMGLADGA